MTLYDLVHSATVQGSISVCEQSEKDVLKWKRRGSYETSDLSHNDIQWAQNMEVKYIYEMAGTLYIEVAQKE